MPIHCASVGHHHHHNNSHRGTDHHHLQRSRSSPTSITYDISEVKITRCVVKSEGRKEVRVQAFFELRKDPKVKGRKQKSFSISKFGLDGAWARANRCKEFIDQLQRFPVDENEVDAFQGKAATSIISDHSNSLASLPPTGIVATNIYNTNKENLSPAAASDSVNNEWSPFRAATFDRTSSRRTAAGYFDQNFRNSEHNELAQSGRLASGATGGLNPGSTGNSAGQSSAGSATSRGTIVSFSQQNAGFRRRMSNLTLTGNHLGDQPSHNRSYGAYSSTNTPSAFFPCPPPMSRHDGNLLGVVGGPDCLYPTIPDLATPSIHISSTPITTSYLLEEMDSKSFLYIARFLTARALSSLEKTNRAIRHQVSEDSAAWKACFFGTLPHMAGLAAQEEAQSRTTSIHEFSRSRVNFSNHQQLHFPFKTASTPLYKAFLAYEFATRNWLLYNEMRQNAPSNDSGSSWRDNDKHKSSSNTDFILDPQGRVEARQMNQCPQMRSQSYSSTDSVSSNASSCGSSARSFGSSFFSQASNSTAATMQHHLKSSIPREATMDDSVSPSILSFRDPSTNESGLSLKTVTRMLGDDSQHDAQSGLCGLGCSTTATTSAPKLPIITPLGAADLTSNNYNGYECAPASGLQSASTYYPPYMRMNSGTTTNTVLQHSAGSLQAPGAQRMPSANSVADEQNFHAIFEGCRQTIQYVHSCVLAKREKRQRSLALDYEKSDGTMEDDDAALAESVYGGGKNSGIGSIESNVDDDHEFYVMEWFLSQMNSLLTSVNN